MTIRIEKGPSVVDWIDTYRITIIGDLTKYKVNAKVAAEARIYKVLASAKGINCNFSVNSTLRRIT